MTLTFERIPLDQLLAQAANDDSPKGHEANGLLIIRKRHVSTVLDAVFLSSSKPLIGL